MVHLEAKATGKSMMRVTGNWWRKAMEQGRNYGKRVTLLQVAFMVRYPETDPEVSLRWVIMKPSVYRAVWGRIRDRYAPRTRTDSFTVNQLEYKTWAWHQNDVNASLPFQLHLDSFRLVVVPENYVTPEAIKIMESL